MKYFVKLLGVVLLIGLTSPSYANFVDDFDSFSSWTSEGVVIPGNNGWVRGVFPNYVRNEGVIAASGFGGSQGAGPNAIGINHGFGHVFRDISGDVVEEELYTWQVAANAPALENPAGLGINVGGAIDVLCSTCPITQQKKGYHLTFGAVSQIGASRFEGGTVSYGNNDGWDDGGVTNIAELGWFEMKIEVDMNARTAGAFFRDIDDTTGVGGAWSLVHTYASIPFTTLGGAGIRLIGDSVVDNVFSGVPTVQSIAGDFDGDGDVDGDDFLVWQNGFPTLSSAAVSDGDADGDGDVDGDDFLAWQNAFPFPTSLAQTPEPTSLVLLALGGLLMVRRRRGA